MERLTQYFGIIFCLCCINLSISANVANHDFFAGNDGDVLTIKTYNFPTYQEAVEKTDVEKHSSEQEYKSAVKDNDFEFQKITYSSDNLKVITYLYKPKKLSDKKYPAIIFNRGSYVRGDIAPELISIFHRLAQNGFVILAPMYRQSDGGEGRDLLGGEDMNDLMNILPLAKNLEFIDTENLFMYGESRGGMMTYQAIRNGFPIKAAAVYGAFTDLEAMFKSQPDKYTPQIAKTIWNDFETNKEEIYKTRSAIKWVDKFDVPILIMHGGEDSDVSPQQPLKLTQKLSEMNKVYELVIFAEDNHILSVNKLNRDSKAINWFDRYKTKRSKNVENDSNAERQALELWNKKIEWQQKREPADYRKFIPRFIEKFNSNELSKVTELASESFLKDLTQEKFIGFLKFFKDDYGKIKSMRFKYFDKQNQRRNAEELAVYNLEFENDSQWDFRVGIDEKLSITKLIITDNNYNEDLPLVKSRTPLQLPFEKGDKWFVLWGGDTQEDNYHVVSRSQKNAIDFLIRHPWSNKSYKTDGKTNKDYYAFGKPILSPADGIVVKVIDGVEDNEPGKMNPKQLTGNTVIIRSKQGEYILLAHFKNSSIKVKENDKVKAGDLLGLCGNSGNSSEPHLHIHVMDKPEMKEATGLKMFFEELILNEESETKNYSPVRSNVLMKK